MSLLPVFSPCQAFKSVVQSRPHVSIYSNPHITCTHAITSSPSSHPRSLRVWILVAWLFAFACYPVVTLSGSPTTYAVLPFGLRVRLASVVIGHVFVLPALICFCDKPSPSVHIASHTRDNCDDYLASHRSKHVLPVSFALSLHITLPVLLLVVFPRYSVLPISSLQCFSFFFSPYIYRALRMYCILANHDVYTSALSAVAAAIAWAPIYNLSRR